MPDSEKSAASSSPLLIATEGRVRILSLNRPERMNALTPELHHLLRDAVIEVAEDSRIGALVLTGVGRGFCAGGDVKRSGDKAGAAQELPETLEGRADALRRHGWTTSLLSEMPKPTIALINGAAAGSGLALALACDLRIAANSAVLQTAYARVGLSGDLGISYFLTRIVGYSRAVELMLLNPKLDANAAEQLGLVHRVVEADRLQTAGRDLAQEIGNGPSLAFRYIKQNLLLAETDSLANVIEREAYNTARCVRTQDVKEATTAFREKRDPVFKGN